MEPAVAEIVAALEARPKYARLMPAALVRVARWAWARHGAPEAPPRAVQAALRAARAKLHQVSSAYLTLGDLRAVERRVAGLPAPCPAPAARAAAERMLARHASSAERHELLPELYERLLRGPHAPRPLRTIVDLGCGLHPFALPWMGLEPSVAYHACDLDLRLVAAIEVFLTRIGQRGGACACDLLGEGGLPARIPAAADVVLLLKTVPCLEAQEAGASVRLLERLAAPLLVVSFPTRSLTGRAKGMEAHYATLAERLGEALGRWVERIAYPEETFYLLTCGSRIRSARC